MTYADLNQPSFTREDYNQLLDDAIQWTSYVSNGKLQDINRLSILSYILNAIVWCHREIELFVEDLPTAGVLKFLSEVAGIKRGLGSKALATVEVTLKKSQSSQFTLEANYQLSSQGSNLLYYTTDRLVIEPGAISGTVTIEAEEPGSIYNTPAFTINNPFLQYANLQSISNIEPALGGTDAETEEEAYKRGGREIRRRDNLLSQDDIEDYVVEQLGPGSSARAVAWYERFGSNKVGEIEIYALDAGGTPLNNALRASLQAIIQPKMVYGHFNTVKPMSPLLINAVVNFVITEFADPFATAQQVYDTFLYQLSPTTIQAGQDININKLIGVFQENPSILELGTLKLNNEGGNILMPNNFTIATPGTLVVELSTPSGDKFGPYYFGQVELD